MTDEETRDRERRRVNRHIGASILWGMAETDTSLQQLAERMGDPADDATEGGALDTIFTLIDGRPVMLDRVADVFTAMGLVFEAKISSREEPDSQGGEDHEAGRPDSEAPARPAGADHEAVP